LLILEFDIHLKFGFEFYLYYLKKLRGNPQGNKNRPKPFFS